jgi:GDP-mannose 4,6-dehydratase
MARIVLRRDMVKNLVTGAGGFVASHLIDYLLTKKEEVIGTIRWNENLERTEHIKDKIKLVPADLLDLSSLFRVIADNKPDYIFHLAAQSYVNDGFTNPIITFQTNATGTLNVLEAVRLIREYLDKEYNPVIHVCSSSEFYGKVNYDEIPITESSPMRPSNQYGAGKVGADACAYVYAHYYGMKVIRTRFFTHTGDRRSMMSAECNFARQIAEFEKQDKINPKEEYILKHGNLESVRTWANVKDAVKAYWLLSRKGIPGEVYNIGGRIQKTIGEMLRYMISLSPIKHKIKPKIDLTLIRKLDVNLQVADITKFENATGWTPEISFEQTMLEVLNYWRTK